MSNDDLHQPLKAINTTIARLREDVQTLTGEVKKIPTAITEAAQSVRDAIHENIQAQAELKLMEHVMEVRSVTPQIEAERDQIQTEREELDARLEKIGERYEKQHADLDETARERIRDVGSHIFELDEHQFENGIEDPFADQVTDTWQSLQAHNTTVGDERTDAVRDTTGEVVQTIHDYIDRQATLIDTIENHRLDAEAFSLPTDREEPLQVPYYIVEYEVDGVTKRQTVVPSQIETTDTGWCSVSLSPVTGATELLDGVEGTHTPDTTETLTEAEFTRTIERVGESSLVGHSYADAAAETLPDEGRVSVAVEGGSN